MKVKFNTVENMKNYLLLKKPITRDYGPKREKN